jgi:N-acetylglutamate synthase-like GNAT family acetyltransferase
MNIRNVKIIDAKTIYSLINCYAERDKMLFCSLADIYENLQAFTVAELDMLLLIGLGSLAVLRRRWALGPKTPKQASGLNRESVAYR